jgi:hypothetical protein
VSWGPRLGNLAVTAGLVAVLMLATCWCSPRSGASGSAHIYTRNRGQGPGLLTWRLAYGV